MISFDQAKMQISVHAIEKIEDIAKLDFGREARRGVPEIIFAENKEQRDIIRIAFAAIKHNGRVVVSRVRKNDLSKVVKSLRKKGIVIEIGKNSTTFLAYVDKSFDCLTTTGPARIGIIAAGTSDIGVAEEARLVAKEMVIQNVGAIVVVAGMEGALASVVASVVDIPVVGVPTSIGYGFGAKGIAALASMLQSCTLGLAVVNIDNGIGAGAYAASIAKRMIK
jgi:NCAIR mutase (PurE)-related protein